MRRLRINKIYNCDCLDLMAKMPDKMVDLILTDPPYGINMEYDVYDDTEESWYKLMSKVIPEMRRVAKMVIMPSCQIAKPRMKWIYKNYAPDWLICWYKGSTGTSSYIGFNDWEPHLVYGKTRSNLSMHDYFRTKASHKQGTFGHPCSKPDDWAEWLIRRATIEGDLIYDPFLGSGTVLKIAVKNNRKYIGSDISGEYCTMAQSRLNEYKQYHRSLFH